MSSEKDVTPVPFVHRKTLSIDIAKYVCILENVRNVVILILTYPISMTMSSV